tara:strand:+ start:1581 stop:2456 length:876 start_codon:yes stop_codon:yes gene_type:complete
VKILITGSNGMLGSSLCQLYNRDNKVFALHRNNKCFTVCNEDYSFDLTDSNKLLTVFNRIEPDLVVHCAGLTNMDKCEEKSDLAYESNVIVTENISKACTNNTKLIYISTDQVYGSTTNYSENNIDIKPLNEYGKTKHLGEKKCIQNNPNSIIIRTNIFGWNVIPKKVSSAEWMYNSLSSEREITLFNDYIFSPIFTETLGQITMQLVDMSFSGIINVGSSVPCSKYEFGMQLAKQFSFDQSLINEGSISGYTFNAQRANDISMNTQMISELGISVPDYKESIIKFKQASI